MKSSTRFLSLALAVLLLPLLLWCPPDQARAEGVKKSILYINSYHHGYQWSDFILEGIRNRLAASSYKIDLQIEYMDAKKYNYESVNKGLLQLYQEKFSTEYFDVVIVSDDDALSFAVRHRDELFPGVPLVFCGVNDLSPEEIQSGNLTGIVENFDLAGTIEVALKLHPDKRRMVVVGDNSTAGLAIKSQIEKLVLSFRDRLKVDYWAEIDLEEVQKRVENLAGDTFLFFIPYYQVIGSRFYTAEEMMASIYAHSTVPIYTAWGFLLGHGAVGGSLLSGVEHGQAAADLALQILDGTYADDIPVSLEPSGSFMFDYNVLQRLNIDRKILPEGSSIINVPNPLYELSRELFWTIMVSLLLLVLASILLVANMIARRQGERRIKDQLTFQETLIDTIPQLISWKDVKGRYVGANRTFVNFFGLQEISEVVNKTTRDVVGDANYVQWSMSADAAVVSGQAGLRKVRREIIDSSGQSSWLELNKVALRDQNGRIHGILTTAENVTRERSLEKQLLQSQKMEAIGTLAGGIAHDFNNILTSIINSTELAIGDVAAGSQTEKDLERVLKAARRGGRVVKQILAFSRPSQEGFRSTDLGAVILEVINLMEVSLPGNITIRSYISPGLGAIHADPTQIHQTVMNLCTNAFHALREQGGEIQLRLEEAVLAQEESVCLDLAPGSYVRLSVADNGTGIPAAIIDKIFDPFFSSKDKAEGTGLGLTVALGIVKGHGGGLRVRSEIGQGTLFEIFLPRIEMFGEAAGQQAEYSGQREGRILFVEDDPDQLQSAARILEGQGYRVKAVGGSGDAAALVEADPTGYDILITDYDMPGLNGVDLVHKVHEWAPELPVIMLSGREDAVAAAAELASIKKFFVKPYDKGELSAVINSLLQRA